MHDPFPLVSKTQAIGADMRVVGLHSASPPQVRTLDIDGDWDGFALASLSYQNDGSAPPQGTIKWPDTYPRWVLIDFAFGGRFV